MKKIDAHTEKLIKNEIKEISKFLENWDNIKNYRNSDHIGILSGLPGIILTLFEHSKIDSKINHKDVLNQYFDRTLKILDDHEYLSPTYCDGLAGYGIFLLKLKMNAFIDIHDQNLINQIDEILIQIDEILDEYQNIYYGNNNIDILHGLLGLGMYFIERKDSFKINEIVKLLDQRKSITKEGYVYWEKQEPYNAHDTILDMGNAHGIGSNIFFLSKVLSKKNILTADSEIIVKDLINKSIDFYLNNAQDITNDICCFYPVKIIAAEFEMNTITPKNSRLGWCYGDLAVLYTLLMASIQIENKAFEKKVIEKLLFVAARKLEDEKNFIDAGFCHGTSGIAIMFLNIYNISGNKIFWETAHYWLQETFKKKDEIDSNGYKNYNFKIEKSSEKNISILEGLSGVLVCFLKFLDFDTNISEELLMIKY